jgi:arylsulfatase
MHFRTHAKPKSVGQAGRWQSEYHDAMIDHDKWVGELLQHLDDLGIADDTIVIYGTDNGPHMNSWPDAGMTPFRNEKDSNWEDAFRVPWIVRWPGVIQPRSVCNQIISNLDWLPTLLAPPVSPTSRRSFAGHNIGDEPTRCISTATTSCPISRARRRRVRGWNFSTSRTTAI